MRTVRCVPRCWSGPGVAVPPPDSSEAARGVPDLDVEAEVPQAIELGEARETTSHDQYVEDVIAVALSPGVGRRLRCRDCTFLVLDMAFLRPV